jgi:hypothetical protein
MAKESAKLVEALDHPIIFILFVTLAVCGMSTMLTWGFKSLGWSGPAAVVQHP